MTLKDITDRLDVWQDWKKNYGRFVPRFINEASTKARWEDWDQEVFTEYFERSTDQCVSSMKQGYFTNAEKEAIRDDWAEHVAPLLKAIALNQESLQLHTYETLKNNLFEYTIQYREAAVNRMIAGLQPNLLSTIVTYHNLNDLYRLILSACNVEIPGYVFDNWFVASNAVLNFFKRELGEPDAYKIMTYPWQTLEELRDNKINDLVMEKEKDKIINLLRYKKQIILQGPPGTGKTKLAKEIATELTKKVAITETDIQNNISVGLQIPSADNYTQYTVTKVDSIGVTLCLKNSDTTYRPSYKEISNAFSIHMWDGKQKGGKDAYSAAIAKHVYLNMKTDELKILQFHPSYTYEDFVRGITVKTDKSTPVYMTENRIIAKMCDEANENFLASRKPVDVMSREITVRDQFLKFVDTIRDHLDNENPYKITDSVSISDIEDDAFRYTGVWEKDRRMKFSDLINIYIAGADSRAAIQRLSNVSGLAKQHSTYFLKVKKKFDDYLDVNPLPTTQNTQQVTLKNYVLILDEINRANLSSVFGELIYALEYRGKQVDSIYSIDGDNKLVVPPNFFLIGTMNTADRSVGHIDYAIRRRFAFVDVLPTELSQQLGDKFHTQLFQSVSNFFRHDSNLSHEFEPKDVQLGHSYFIDQSQEGGSMDIRLEFEIKPILREYVKDGILIGPDIENQIEQLTA